jgi:NAD(P)-dependent dehydrogenase (short-subunit alcohol dehydrogenase family)
MQDDPGTGASSGIGKQTAIAVSKAEPLVNTGATNNVYSKPLNHRSAGHIMIPADLTLQEDRDRLVELLPV